MAHEEAEGGAARHVLLSQPTASFLPFKLGHFSGGAQVGPEALSIAIVGQSVLKSVAYPVCITCSIWTLSACRSRQAADQAQTARQRGSEAAH